MFDCGVFRRLAKSVIAHRVKHIKALHHFKTGNHIRNRVITDMAHVDFSRRVRKHFKDIIFGLSRIKRNFKSFLFVPSFTPLVLNALDFLCVVRFHFNCSPLALLIRPEGLGVLR